MIIEVKVPSPGESINEVEIANWLVSSGDYVVKNQDIAVIESDKATLSIVSEYDGIIDILVNAGSLVKVGSIACKINTEGINANNQSSSELTSNTSQHDKPKVSEHENIVKNHKITPLAKKILDVNNIKESEIAAGSERISKAEVEKYISSTTLRKESREKMSMLRRKISQRLVSVKNETAMLTTFNEIDMSKVLQLRSDFKDKFFEKHGVKLGLMSFFTKAACEALNVFPKVNSFIDGEEIVNHSYIDISIAVQTEKGLMVPNIRNAEQMGIADIEKEIARLAEKARNGKITIDELSGGTFTISNGGVFGSMLSTPILNPPQSAILGMHNIIERPVAVNKQVEIRPMMYVALSYDHRIIDGRESVGFLMKIKELIEDPLKFIKDGKHNFYDLLNI